MKTPDSIYREKAKEMNLPFDVVKKVNDFFWKEGVKKNIQNVVYDSIFVRNLGSFSASRPKLYKIIYKEIQYIRNIMKSVKFTPENQKDLIDKRKDNLRKLLRKRNELALFKIKKIERRQKTKNEKNLGIIEVSAKSNH